MAVAIIPARGGSKRIPHKNIRNICGKPMISWPIYTALMSNVFSAVRVTTDCPEIARVSQDAGAEVPHLRDVDLADDYTSLDAVVRDAISVNRESDDWVCMIYATAIMLRPQTLQLANELAMAAQLETDFIIGVRPYPHPPQRAIRFDADNNVSMVATENAVIRTQDLEPLYHDAAQFVFGRRSAWMNGRTVWNSITQGVIIPSNEAVDIDTPDDLMVAEALLNAKRTKRR